MRWIRIYTDQMLQTGAQVALVDTAARHLTQVLRLRAGDRLSLFNGDGYDYPAVVSAARKQQVMVEIDGEAQPRPRPPIPITLGQAMIKGERMDWAIQKAVELGVSHIAPLISERVEVRLSGERIDKRLRHWRGVVASACEQCGRADLPEISQPQAWHEWADQSDCSLKLALVPEAAQPLGKLKLTAPSIAVAIGPEGGWSDSEAAGWALKNFTPVRLGGLILRAETAGLAALAVIQGQVDWA